MPAHYTHISFLDDIARIAVRNYEPSDDDVVRARLRTLGVQEHRLVMERSGKAFRRSSALQSSSASFLRPPECAD